VEERLDNADAEPTEEVNEAVPVPAFTVSDCEPVLAASTCPSTILELFVVNVELALKIVRPEKKILPLVPKLVVTPPLR